MRKAPPSPVNCSVVIATRNTLGRLFLSIMCGPHRWRSTFLVSITKLKHWMSRRVGYQRLVAVTLSAYPSRSCLRATSSGFVKAQRGRSRLPTRKFLVFPCMHCIRPPVARLWIPVQTIGGQPFSEMPCSEATFTVCHHRHRGAHNTLTNIFEASFSLPPIRRFPHFPHEEMSSRFEPLSHVRPPLLCGMLQVEIVHLQNCT